ncbi:AMP-binding enzyme [Microvirga zambiensis]|uniref:AMP-binding enzyme n=1 Tax=Microvirga zambiensis TaxID=1402137 RepID=UPI00191EAB4E
MSDSRTAARSSRCRQTAPPDRPHHLNSVIAVPDTQRGERIVAMLALRDQTVTRSALIAHGRQALPLFKVPRVYGVVTDWPLTRSGKTDLEALREAWRQGGYKALQ